MEDIYIVDCLEWSFPFGKYKYKNIMDAIEESPSVDTGGITDVYGNKHLKGYNFIGGISLISYLEWAEKNQIIKIHKRVWEQIKYYDFLFTNIENYKNGVREIDKEEFKKLEKKIKILRSN